MKSTTLILSVVLALLFKNSSANNLIYTDGFDNTALIGGNISGITVNEASNNEAVHLTIEFDGQIEQTRFFGGSYRFFSHVPIGSNFTIRIGLLPSVPNKMSCAIVNNNGTQTSAGKSNVDISCDNTDWKWGVMNWSEGGWQ